MSATTAEPAADSADSRSAEPDVTAEPQVSAVERDLATLRGQIDALDAAITRLVAERTQLSRRAQQLRISAGGTRVELGRERVIREHYRATLGIDGPNLAEAVLRVGRGHR
jgi:chorismate mutase